jgi:hypothetical protein
MPDGLGEDDAATAVAADVTAAAAMPTARSSAAVRLMVKGPPSSSVCADVSRCCPANGGILGVGPDAILTNGEYVTADEHIARIREVRTRLAREGPPWTRGNEGDFQAVTLPERDCDLLRDLLIAERVQTVVEVGLAYASSALAVGEALITVGAPDPRHVVIDPFQQSAWSNVGWDLLCSAGLDSIASLRLLPSSIALAQLVTEGVIADAAVVDGSHRFHEVFVDLYFLRKIVRPGGLVVADDDWAPSVRTAVRYYEQNLGWQVIPEAFAAGTLKAINDDPAAVEVPRCRALRLPDPSFEPSFQDFRPF